MGTLFLSSSLVGEPFPKTGKRALLGDLDIHPNQERAPLEVWVLLRTHNGCFNSLRG